MKNIFFLLSFCFTLFSNNTFAQIKISDSFSEKLTQMDLEFLQPLEQSYKKTSVYRNDILKYDFAIKARKADMEIRFILEPESANGSSFPHIHAPARASSVATNDEDSRMVFHDMSKKDLKEYGADWGSVFFFQPKEDFTDKDHCKLLVLYKEGKGTAYVFYLFDKATEEVDYQKFCLMFEKEELDMEN